MGLYQSQYADAQSQQSFGAGLSSLGGAIISNLGTINAIGKGFGGGGMGVTGPSWFGNSGRGAFYG
jgi:hypothetical protein